MCKILCLLHVSTEVEHRSIACYLNLSLQKGRKFPKLKTYVTVTNITIIIIIIIIEQFSIECQKQSGNYFSFGFGFTTV